MKKEWVLMVGLCGSECDGVVFNSCFFLCVCFGVFGLIEFVTQHILRCHDHCHCAHNGVRVAD